MDMIPCESSQIKAYGYDAEERTMAIEFTRGGTYHYHDVPTELFKAFSESDSKGSYHARNIKGIFHGDKVI